MIPFDISGTVHIPTTVRSNAATVKAVTNRLAAMLDDMGTSETYVEGSRVRYVNSWYRLSSRYNVLAASGSGFFDITVEAGEINVRFSVSHFRQLMTLSVLAAFILLLHGEKDAHYWNGTSPAILPVLLAAFYIFSYAVTWGRVWFWLKRGLAGVSELSMRV